MKRIEGGVTAPKGFQAAGLYAGIKKGHKKDMAMIFSEAPCRAAGVFTTNVVKAAPVKWDYKVVHESKFAQAVVVNSGVANACTGEEGYACCRETAGEAGKLLGIPEDAVLVASTGVIGAQLPMDTIKAGVGMLVPALGSGREDAALAAEAIRSPRKWR